MSHPAAVTAPDLHRCFQTYCNQSDLEGLLSLYNERASLVLDDGSVLSGRKMIAGHFQKLLSFSPVMELRPARTIEAGDTAVLISDWQLVGKAPNGELFQEAGRTYDVVRRRQDGFWEILFDSPWGGEKVL